MRKLRIFEKILIANRGEIACRVIKTAREMGVKTVAVYSRADRTSLHVRMADEAVFIGEAESSASYLRGDVIIKAALDCGAQAIHPAYGFLSENVEFAKSCAAAGLTFIGPSPEAISAMGLKDHAKDIMSKAGVPIVAGYQGDNQGDDYLARQAKEIGYPVLIKAVAGGGGKGMRLVEHQGEFMDALATCRREAKAAFDNDIVLIEKYLTKPRHIEVQIFGDTHGNVVHLFERDCSLQRRHQKIVEEAPAPNISDEFRKNICAAAVRAAKAINYHGAGTVEFIVQGDEFHFMEMNTRLQVEHPVTEMITGQDLVEWQLRVAAGEELPLKQDDIVISGHAFEVRLYAEDPAQNFLPQTGRVEHFSYPEQTKYMRVDTGIEGGDTISAYYDPMVAKLISHGETRAQAAVNMADLLGRTYLTGLPSNQEFLSNIFASEAFISANIDTGFITNNEADLLPDYYGLAGTDEIALAALYYLSGLGNMFDENPWNARDNWRIGSDSYKRKFKLVNKGEITEIDSTAAVLVSYDAGKIIAMVNGMEITAHIIEHRGAITIFYKGRVIDIQLASPESQDEAVGDGKIIAPMTGKIIRIMAAVGDSVEKGQALIVMESMKVEIPIIANCCGVIEAVNINVDEQISDGTLLIEITPEEGEPK